MKMKVGPNTLPTAGTVVATLGSGIAASSLPGGSAIGGVMTAVGQSSLVGGHVIVAATPIIAAAAPFVLLAAGGAAIGYAIHKALED